MRLFSSLTLIAFFSILIIAIVMFFLNINLKKDSMRFTSVFLQNKSALSSPFSNEILKDRQTIQSASISGTIICTKEDPSICNANQEGKVLEYFNGCTTNNFSSSSIYICKNGRWVYSDWTDHGWCNFCKNR